MQEKLIAITFSLLMLGQAWLVRRHVGTWIFPACIFGLFWFGFTFIPLVILFAVPVEPLAVGYILVACLLFSGAALVFDWGKAYQANKAIDIAARYDTRFLWLSFYGLSWLVVLCLVINWTLQGFLLREIVFDLFATANKYLERRYAGEISKNVVSQIGVVLTYPAAILGGVVYAARRNRWDGLATICIAFLASVLTMVVEGNKGTLFLVAALFWAGILVNSIGKGDGKILGEHTLTKIVIGALVLLPFLVSAFWIRMPELAGNYAAVIEKMTWYFASYTSGHLYAFSDWFSSLIGKESTQTYVNDFGAHGFYTFMAVFRALGDSRVVPPGIYPEFFAYQNVLQSNIYTVFRGLITDFGLYGALLFWVGAGLVVHAFFRSLLLGRNQALSISVFAHFVGFVYSSFIVSFFVWNSIYASIVVTAIIFQINYWIRTKNFGVLS